jgi:hypothetical protein
MEEAELRRHRMKTKEENCEQMLGAEHVSNRNQEILEQISDSWVLTFLSSAVHSNGTIIMSPSMVMSHEPPSDHDLRLPVICRKSYR